MNARDRFVCGVLSTCVFAIVLATPARGQALDSTPRITRGTCPAAHCNLGLWQSSAAVPVFTAPGTAKPIFTLQPRVPFEALGGETYAIPGVHVLRAKLDIFDERTTRSLRRGDTIRTIAYLGEGRFQLEAAGRAGVAVMDEHDAARLQTLRPRRETWWVEVKAPDGRRGWIDAGNPNIAGESFEEAMAPLSPALLDSAFLAGLTGPVAAIVRERGSSAVTSFEARVEGADGGEGVAWWSAGRLRLVHLRFRTMLARTGTTSPENSGLPADAVVCCGDLVYHRLMVFTRREPEYMATITIPDRGDRHVVEAFFRDGRMVRLLRDGRAVPIAYSDSVMGRAWYSASRAVVQQVATNGPGAGAHPARAGAAPSPATSESRLGRKALVGFGVILAMIVLLGVAAWQWLRRRGWRPPWAREPATTTAAPPEEPEGWVCPYCHADVLVDVDECWLCGRPRPTEATPPRAAPELICACGEPAPPGTVSCKRCGKSFRTRVF